MDDVARGYPGLTPVVVMSKCNQSKDLISEHHDRLQPRLRIADASVISEHDTRPCFTMTGHSFKLRNDATARAIVTSAKTLLISTANERVYVRISTLRRPGSGPP